MNKRIYVGNLSFDATEDQLRQLFEEDGRQVASVKIINDRETGRPRGFAFVEMANDNDGQKAIEALNGREFMGRALLVNEAREQQKSGGGAGRGGFGGGNRDRGNNRRGGW